MTYRYDTPGTIVLAMVLTSMIHVRANAADWPRDGETLGNPSINHLPEHPTAGARPTQEGLEVDTWTSNVVSSPTTADATAPYLDVEPTTYRPDKEKPDKRRTKSRRRHRRHRQGPGHAARGLRDSQRGAHVVMHRLDRLEHKVDMLLQMTHRARRQAEMCQPSHGCPYCRGYDRDEKRRRRGDSHVKEEGRRHRHHRRSRSHRHHDGRENHTSGRRHHPAEWDAPPENVEPTSSYDHSAEMNPVPETYESEWDDPYVNDPEFVHGGIPMEHLSWLDAIDRLETYFEDGLDIEQDWFYDEF
ncbi:MAG: hypothetical protein MK179_16785 [Pirellulaceae bacterium]|nr:hypothetical protein [Pirellulaceae bacterium]